jgi:spore germination protein GerM
MNTKKLILPAFLFILLIVLGVIFFRSDLEKRALSGPVVSDQDTTLGPEESRETRKVVVFFLSEQDGQLHPEEREIYADTLLVHQAKQTIEELIKGPHDEAISPLPPETKLREMYITPMGIAYVDFSREIQENHLSGSSAEVLTIYAIVNSLTYNFKSIKRVFILVDGGEQETLSGHVNLRRPFLPRYDLIAN